MNLRIASLMALATAVHLPGLSAHVDAPAEPQRGTSRGETFHLARGSMLGRRPPLPFGNCQPAPRNPYPKSNAANHFGELVPRSEDFPFHKIEDTPEEVARLRERVQHFNPKEVELYIGGEKFDPKVFIGDPIREERT